MPLQSLQNDIKGGNVCTVFSADSFDKNIGLTVTQTLPVGGVTMCFSPFLSGIYMNISYVRNIKWNVVISIWEIYI